MEEYCRVNVNVENGKIPGRNVEKRVVSNGFKSGKPARPSENGKQSNKAKQRGKLKDAAQAALFLANILKEADDDDDADAPEESDGYGNDYDDGYRSLMVKIDVDDVDSCLSNVDNVEDAAAYGVSNAPVEVEGVTTHDSSKGALEACYFWLSNAAAGVEDVLRSYCSNGLSNTAVVS